MRYSCCSWQPESWGRRLIRYLFEGLSSTPLPAPLLSAVGVGSSSCGTLVASVAVEQKLSLQLSCSFLWPRHSAFALACPFNQLVLALLYASGYAGRAPYASCPALLEALNLPMSVILVMLRQPAHA